MKTIVGISGYFLSKEQNIHSNFDYNIVPKELTDSIRLSGAIPFIIPLSKPEEAKDYIDRVDALVLAGGQDVDPLLFLEEPLPKIGEIEPERDAFELALIEAAWEQKKAILGICRGMQLLNVASEGSLYQDVSYYEGLEVDHIQKTPWKYATHSVIIEEDSWLGEALGTETVINSYHHQAIKKVGDAFRPVAWAKDDIIEAIESKDKSQKVMAVQWHPEILQKTDPSSLNIFKKFLSLVETNV